MVGFAVVTSASPDLPITHVNVRTSVSTSGSDVLGSEASLSQAQANVAAAQSRVDQAKANAVKAQLDVDRYTPLVAKDVISKQQFDAAVALIKPGKSLAEVDTKSVRKRMKDKAFARKVNRDDIVNGATALGVDLDEHIAFCIAALQGIADRLGLQGS